MSALRSRVTYLALALGILATFLPASMAYADDVDRLRSQLESDQSRFSQLVKQVNDAPLNTSADATALASTLEGTASSFRTSAANYRSLAKNSSIANIAQLAAQGADSIADGAQTAASGLRLRNGQSFQTGQTQMDAGRQTLSNAIDQYNAYVDAHPSSGSGLGNLAQQPLGLVTSLGPPVLGLGIYLLIVGFVLNALFQSRLTRFASGVDARLNGGELTGVYGIHLVLLVTLGYVTLAFAAVLVVAFGLVGGELVLSAGRIPVMLPVALLAVVLVTLWGIVKGLFGTARGGTFGIEVDAQAEPRLWRLSTETAGAVGTRPADTIVISPLPGISVHEEGGLLQLLLGRTRRVLTVGAPSILGLTVQQFQAILGHEYGHFSNRDTAWSSLTYRAGSAVSQTLGAMATVSTRGGWFALVSLVNPARWALWLYRMLFAYTTSGFSRMREVYADKEAIERYGARPFKDGLRQVVVNDVLFGKTVVPQMVALAREGRYLSNVYDAEAAVSRDLSPATAEEIVTEVSAERPSAFDSHPPLRDRLTYADRFVDTSASSSWGGSALLVDQFADWVERSTELSRLLTYSMFRSQLQQQAQSAGPSPA